MRIFKRAGLLLGLLLCGLVTVSAGQQKVRGADERFKVDILVVVAHPDDEGAVTPYLARAIYDLHKRVAVVYATRGGSGGNSYSSERAGALADMREIEAREACAKLGITNVWFLQGKDTASQNVLNSLANWGHGANLEKMVELIRLTRPDVIITSLPQIFIGENHGDHQATGVIATEAFDLAANPTMFPEQLAGASPQREVYLQNLNTWQPKKLYYFADAQDDTQFAGTGPAYSITEISPSQKKPYWKLALDAAVTHLTQYPAEIDSMKQLSDADLEKRMKDPNQGWWSNPQTLIFGKAAYQLSRAQVTDDVFADFDATPLNCGGGMTLALARQRQRGSIQMSLGGPWDFYDSFHREHCESSLPAPKIPEIAVKNGSIVNVPIAIYHDADKNLEVTVSVTLEPGWKAVAGTGPVLLPAEERTEIQVQIAPPTWIDAANVQPQGIGVEVTSAGQPKSVAVLRVLVKNSALPQ